MNKLKYLIYTATIALLASCADPELGPVVTFETATIGAYVRFVSQDGNAEFDLANPSTSQFSYCVDFVDLQGGELVNEYALDVQFFDNTPFNGDNSVARTNYITETSFSPSPAGNPGTCVTVTLEGVLAAAGLSVDDVSASDQFALYGVVRTSEGAEYSSNNTTATVRGAAFQGFFDLNVNATCPLASDVFVGDYAVTFEGAAGTGYGLPFAEGTYTLSTVAGSSTRRTMDVVYLPAIGGFGPYSFDFDFVCDKADFLGMTAGVGCGMGSLMMGPITDENGFLVSPAVDISDDSQFKLLINEGANTSGCASVSATETTVVFTKL